MSAKNPLDSPIFASPGGRLISIREQQLVLSFLGKISSKLICDVGTGTGRLARIFIENGAQVIGVDINLKELKQTSSEFKRRHPDWFKPIVADACSLPFKDSTFDSIVCFRVLKYIPQYCLAIREMKRVLKPKGILVLEISNLYSWETLLRFKHFVRNLKLCSPHFFRKKQIRNLLHQEGLMVIASAPTYKIPFFFWSNIKSQKFLSLLSSLHRALLALPEEWLARGIVLECVKE
jgi:SAM-dependent methyltransferase